MPYPVIIPPDPTPLERLLAYQQTLYETSPLGAHAFGAAMNVGLGLTFGCGRAFVIASMCPRAQMLGAFVTGVRLTAPLYTVPFFLCSQLDAFSAIQSRRNPPQPGTEGARWPQGPADVG